MTNSVGDITECISMLANYSVILQSHKLLIVRLLYLLIIQMGNVFLFLMIWINMNIHTLLGYILDWVK